MENYSCKLHSNKKASHYCCIEKILFCESCLKGHESHLIYTLKEVEELKKNGVDLLKNMNNPISKQNTINKNVAPKIDLNALAATLDKKENINQATKSSNISNTNNNPVTVSSINNNADNKKNVSDKVTDLMKSKTIQNQINKNVLNDSKLTNDSGIASFAKAPDNISNKIDDKNNQVQKICNNKDNSGSNNQVHKDLKAPKNEMNLVDMIIDDKEHDYKSFPLSTLNAKINIFNDNTKKNIIEKRESFIDPKGKTIDTSNNLENKITNNNPLETSKTIIDDEKKISIKDRVNQFKSNNKANELLIDKQTTIKDDKQIKHNQTVKSDFTSKSNPLENMESKKMNHNNQQKIDDKKIIEKNENSKQQTKTNIYSNNTKADSGDNMSIKNNQSSKEIKINILEKTDFKKYITDSNQNEKNKPNDETKDLLKDHQDFIQKEQKIIEESKVNLYKNQNLDNCKEIKNESINSNLKNNQLIETGNNLKETSLKNSINKTDNANNSLKEGEEDRSTKIQHVLKKLQDNNKPNIDIKQNNYNTLNHNNTNISEKLNSLIHPIKNEKVNEEIKRENFESSHEKKENFNKMRDMLGKRLSASTADKDLKTTEVLKAKEINNHINTFKKEETQEKKEG